MGRKRKKKKPNKKGKKRRTNKDGSASSVGKAKDDRSKGRRT